MDELRDLLIRPKARRNTLGLDIGFTSQVINEAASKAKQQWTHYQTSALRYTLRETKTYATSHVRLEGYTVSQVESARITPTMG